MITRIGNTSIAVKVGGCSGEDCPFHPSLTSVRHCCSNWYDLAIKLPLSRDTLYSAVRTFLFFTQKRKSGCLVFGQRYYIKKEGKSFRHTSICSGMLQLRYG